MKLTAVVIFALLLITVVSRFGPWGWAQDWISSSARGEDWSLIDSAAEATRLLAVAHPGQVLTNGLLLLALATILFVLARQLPWQNVLSASAIIGLAAGAVYGLARLAGGPWLLLLEQIGLGDCVLASLVGVLTARRVATGLLEPWKGGRQYGLWLISLTTGLVVFFGFTFQTAAGNREHGENSWRTLVLWGVTGLLAQILATPWLIKERPDRTSSKYQSLVVWIPLNFFFALEGCRAGWSSLVVAIVLVNLLILI